MNNECACLVGTAIGDSLGMPFEMKAPQNPMFKDWDGNFLQGTYHKLEPGQFTDDTQMSLAMTKSLLRSNGFDGPDMARAYLEWYQTGARGMGGTTRTAMQSLERGVPFDKSGVHLGPTGIPVGGNGTAMRACPMGVYFRRDLDQVKANIRIDASITHQVEECILGGVAVAVGAALLARSEATPKDLIKKVVEHLPDSATKQHLLVASRLAEKDIAPTIAMEVIGTSGYVVESVAAAFYCVSRHYGYRNIVVNAVKGGGDADTIAAMAGGLAGIYFGLDGIPEEYKKVVEEYDNLCKLDRLLCEGPKQ
jgi:ADP-ribosylglycohydrolase